MKTTKLILASVMCLLVVASCGQKNKAKTEEAPVEKSRAELQAEAVVMIHLDSLANLVLSKETGSVMAILERGSVDLPASEKQVKPEYLMDPAVTNNLQTVSQKCRAIGILSVDQTLAEMYDMPVLGYKTAIVKLVADTGIPKLADKEGKLNDQIKAIYEDMKEAERVVSFWDMMTAAFIEGIYATTQNTERFIGLLTDEDVESTTWKYTLFSVAMEELASINPEYQPISDALKPLDKLNAINVDMFHKQLIELQGEITAAREALLK